MLLWNEHLRKKIQKRVISEVPQDPKLLKPVASTDEKFKKGIQWLHVTEVTHFTITLETTELQKKQMCKKEVIEWKL